MTARKVKPPKPPGPPRKPKRGIARGRTPRPGGDEATRGGGGEARPQRDTGCSHDSNGIPAWVPGGRTGEPEARPGQHRSGSYARIQSQARVAEYPPDDCGGDPGAEQAHQGRAGVALRVHDRARTAAYPLDVLQDRRPRRPGRRPAAVGPSAYVAALMRV